MTKYELEGARYGTTHVACVPPAGPAERFAMDSIFANIYMYIYIWREYSVIS
jgi:hypothetical protein